MLHRLLELVVPDIESLDRLVHLQLIGGRKQLAAAYLQGVGKGDATNGPDTVRPQIQLSQRIIRLLTTIAVAGDAAPLQRPRRRRH